MIASKYGTRSVKCFKVEIKNQAWKWGWQWGSVIYAPTKKEAEEEYRERYDDYYSKVKATRI